MLKTEKEVEEVNTNVVPTKEFNLEQLFGSKTRVRLLRLLLDNPDRSFYVRELTRRIDAQLNSVRRELKNLIDIGIVLEVDGHILDGEVDPKNVGKATKKKYYRANTVFAFFTELRSIMKKSAVLMNKTFVDTIQAEGTIDYLFLTGKFIDNVAVPSDLLIVGVINLDALQKAIEAFELEIGREVNYTYMPRDEFMYRKEVKDRFLMELIQTEKVVLINNLPEVL